MYFLGPKRSFFYILRIPLLYFFLFEHYKYVKLDKHYIVNIAIKVG